jgi:aspartyl-tRNA(Asn)/glutamyl-tRNA(Gln) amidotransferase subunit A
LRNGGRAPSVYVNRVSPEAIFLARPERPADGIPLAVKDLFDTAGMVTTYGSVIFEDHVPDRTAEAVARLESAGYANAGKSNLHEFAYGITSRNPWYGSVPNPVGPGRTAGGSSGGSAAALAAGLVDAAIGTDSGGSIRIPSACCGTVGFKPSHGLVSLEGCFPLAPSFDHAGPMARDVRGCARMLEALADGFKPRTLAALEEVELGVAWTERADPLVRERVEAVAERFPRRRRLDLPFAEAIAPVFMHEVAGVHRELFATESERYGDNVRFKVGKALALDDATYERAAAEREHYREKMDEACAGVDLLLTPTLAFVAPPADSGELAIRAAMIRFTFPFNALGWPALAVPCGPAELGLPASAQLVSPRGDDALVLAAGELAYSNSRR